MLMKKIIILGDGMADTPCPELEGLTPIQAAHTPNMDRLAKEGKSGMLYTVPDGYTPGSEIAHLSLLGYDLDNVFEGRGSLEAASMGIDIADDEMAMRCNLITIDESGRIKNHSAGHISTSEADELIKTLNESFSDGKSSFHTGVSYRHLLKIKNGDKRITCIPPHDIPGAIAEENMIKPDVPEAAETADYINHLIRESQKILRSHPVNIQRMKDGKDPANSIWPWSAGYKPKMQYLSEKFGIEKGYVISAVDLINGIGVYAGLVPIHVQGATGLFDTNYDGKVKAALNALKSDADFVFLHIEASDEAGHEGDVKLKKKTIENLDSRVVGPILSAIDRWDEEVAIAVLPDHPTPCNLRTHTAHPVPFAIYHKGIKADSVEHYSEFDAVHGELGYLKKDEFINMFMKL